MNTFDCADKQVVLPALFNDMCLLQLPPCCSHDSVVCIGSEGGKLYGKPKLTLTNQVKADLLAFS